MSAEDIDNELILEDEIGELVVTAEDAQAEQFEFEDALTDDAEAQSLMNEFVQEKGLSDDFEELIASTSIEQALMEEVDDKDVLAAATALPYENDNIAKLISAIENLVTQLSAPPSTEQDPQSQFATAIHYVKQKHNPHQAARWFRKAALQGHAKAQFYLGVFFTKGDGVPKSYFHAYSWISLAACQQLPEAVTARKQLESHLTAQETTAALKYAADLFEQMPINN